MSSTLRTLLVVFLFAAAAAGAMAQSPQPPDCGICACAIGGSNFVGAAADPCVGGAPVIIGITAGATYRRFNTTIGTRYLVSVCGATVENTVMYVRNNSSPYLPVEGACDDDGCGLPGGPSSVQFVATQASHRVYLYRGSCGTTITAATNMTITCLGPEPVPLNDEQAADVSKLIDKLEQDEDVQKVFHNMG